MDVITAAEERRVSFGVDVGSNNSTGRAWSPPFRSNSPFQHQVSSLSSSSSSGPAPVAIPVRGTASATVPSLMASHHYHYLQQYPLTATTVVTRRPISVGSNSSSRGEFNASPLPETRSGRASTMESDGSSQSASPFDFLNKYPAAAVTETYSASSIGSVGDDRSVESDRSMPVPEQRRQQPDRRPTRTGHTDSSSGSSSSSSRRSHHHPSSSSPSSINYHGSTMAVAASQGNLPLCVLLWGMATAKKVNLLVPDAEGNTPFHFAALADVPEVLGFLQQQVRSRHNAAQGSRRLVDARNNAGETPLLRAASTGKIPTLKYLLDEGSDPFATDLQGNTVFIVLARCGHLWGIHFVFSVLYEGYGPQATSDFLSATDHEGHTALDWAADLGDVNIIEYLIRRNMDPNRTDPVGRSALHAAVKSGKVEATRFLVKSGCDPAMQDDNKASARALAYASRHPEVIAAVNVRPTRVDRNASSAMVSSTGSRSRANSNNSGCCAPRSACCRRRADKTRDRLELDDGSAIGIRGRDVEVGVGAGVGVGTLRPLGGVPAITDVVQEPQDRHSQNCDMGFPNPRSFDFKPDTTIPPNVTLFSTTSSGDVQPHAICRAKPSRLSYTVLFALVVVGVWVLTTCIPFYVWIVLVLSIVAVVRTFGTQSKHTTDSSDGTAPNECAAFVLNVLTAREKFLGVYLGMVLTCFLFWLFSLRIGVLYGFSTSAAYVSSASAVSFTAPELGAAFLNLGGLSGSTDDVGLFWSAFVSLLIGAVLWSKLVWFDTDPGAVRTRYIDFDVIMDECLRDRKSVV